MVARIPWWHQSSPRKGCNPPYGIIPMASILSQLAVELQQHRARADDWCGTTEATMWHWWRNSWKEIVHFWRRCSWCLCPASGGVAIAIWVPGNCLTVDNGLTMIDGHRHCWMHVQIVCPPWTASASESLHGIDLYRSSAFIISDHLRIEKAFDT